VRLWLTQPTTIYPLRFYLRRGFRLNLVRPGAIDEACKGAVNSSTFAVLGLLAGRSRPSSARCGLYRLRSFRQQR
jgi:hypothetical protein